MMMKKDIFINSLFSIMIVTWSIFTAKIIIYHGLGYMGHTGGFKLDTMIISFMIIFDVVLVGLFTLFNIKRND